MVALLAMIMPVLNFLAARVPQASYGGVVLLSASGSNADISTFTGFASDVLAWIIQSMGTVLTFLIQNPLALWAIIVGAIVMVIGTLFNILKGR